MAAPSVDDLARSFERYLRAGNKSPRTIETYLEAVRGFATTWRPPPAARSTRPTVPSPMARMKPPVVPDQPVPVLTDGGPHGPRYRPLCELSGRDRRDCLEPTSPTSSEPCKPFRDVL
jgi:hypothetical protein